MARAVVTVGLCSTGITVYADRSSIVERYEEVATSRSYEEWFNAVASKLISIRDQSIADLRVIVVLPGTLNREARLVSISPGLEEWEGKQPHLQLHKMLGVPVHTAEAGVALLASECVDASMLPPHIAIAWDAGITAACTLDGKVFTPIAAGHLAGPKNTGTCPCGSQNCINLALAGQVMHSRHYSLDDLERHTWSAQFELFLQFVVMPLAIATPGRVLVIGGEVVNLAMRQGFPVQQTVASWLNHYLKFIDHFVIYEPSSRQPFVDGGLQLLPTA